MATCMVMATALPIRHSRTAWREAAGGDTSVEIGELEAFLLVGERGSLTLAAHELGLTQPGLGRQMQRLERELGVSLFVRMHSGIGLTEAGERFLVYARDAVARYRRCLEDLRGMEGAVSGELRIAASTTPAEFIVPHLVAAFTARHPNVRATVFSTDSEGVADELLDGHWELGFVGARLRTGRLHFDAVAEDEVVLAVPAEHRLAGRGEVRLDDLAGERFVEREGGSGTLMSVRRVLGERGLALPAYRVSMTLTTTQAVVSAVRAGYGIGFVSSLALADQPDGRVVAVRLAGVPLRRQLYLITERGRVLRRWRAASSSSCARTGRRYTEFPRGRRFVPCTAPDAELNSLSSRSPSLAWPVQASARRYGVTTPISTTTAWTANAYHPE